ncbi:hypothetical protein K443DRAFT_320750 [Laccaria amethystina LaAM-08-1]|uniref:Uncharacterized protein n=1 Tax=Laccaria amethystina LaAM-08-1 TaxID=1095629 RepID=A0A0C9X336_9AGAR|nr:hypothetical protein K443DRAFT_320750 [Laccaria amethystina LaAM-08-1]
MSFVGFSLRFRIYRHLGSTPQFTHAVQLPARWRMYGDGVTPHFALTRAFTSIAKCRPPAPFFEAQDVTQNRDVVVGRKSQLHRMKRRGVFPETSPWKMLLTPQDSCAARPIDVCNYLVDKIEAAVQDTGTTTPRNSLSTRCSLLQAMKSLMSIYRSSSSARRDCSRWT